MNKDDLRVQRTHRFLREALIALIGELGYDNVTIRHITDRAQVGYKTFFRHFDSKEALLNTVMERLVNEFQRTVLSPDQPFASETNTINAVHFAEKHATVLLAALHSPASDQLLKPFVTFAHKEGQRTYIGSNIPDELVAHHFASSVFDLLGWWLDNDMPYPPEEMAEYINRLVIRPLKSVLSTSDI
ncbi:MAG: TetR/AcrR family transcriptional regulator [Chloroflexota bacterium]